jgi:NAD(P)H-dependent FMN reductase
MKLKLHIIIGSTRPGRAGPTIAKWVTDAARQQGAFDVELVDLADFKLPLLDEAAHPIMQQYQHAHTRRWAASVQAADAYIFVTPEYNYFPPASLVNALQVLNKEWNYKAAGVVSYGGISGGLRASQELRLLMSTVNMHALPQVVPVPLYPQHIGEEGVFQPNEAMTNGLNGLLAELQKWSGALQTLRPRVAQAA